MNIFIKRQKLHVASVYKNERQKYIKLILCLVINIIYPLNEYPFTKFSLSPKFCYLKILETVFKMTYYKTL